MNNDRALIAELRRDEGVRNKPYHDTVGKLTIGVGRNLDDVGLSDDEVDYLLANDIARVKAELDLAAPWWRDLDEVRQRVILNMAFNLGTTGLMGFRNTLAAVQAGRWKAAAAGMLASKWAKQVKGRAARLAHMMETGETTP